MQRNKALLLCFFLSGATALMYEIIWTRFFTLTFGSSTYSVTTVVSAFMAGLALGSVVFGRIADRVASRVVLYGLLELLIGLYALLFPSLYRLASRLYLSLIDQGSVFEGSELALKFALSFSIMLLPTTLMGGTLPVLSRAFIRDLREVAPGLGLLYAVNTFGAVVGTYLVGFHLLTSIGMSHTMVLAGLTNALIGIAMIKGGKKMEATGEHGKEMPRPLEAKDPGRGKRHVAAFALLAFAASGFVSLAHQVVWTRILTLIIGSSTYAFTMILIGFLLGIALGSALFKNTRLIPPERINLQTFAWLEIGIGLFVFLLIPLFSKLPYLMLKAFHLHGDSYGYITFYQFLLVLIIVIVPTSLMGATFPVIAKVVSRQVQHLGRSIGDTYFFNTFGAIFGPLFAGFLLIPQFGTLNTLKLGITLNILLGLGALFMSAEGLRLRWAHFCFLLLCAAGIFGLLTAEWDPRLMDSGVAIYGKRIVTAEGPDKLKDGSRLLFLEEGVNSTISVRQTEKAISLRINGKVDAGTGRIDMATQLLAGHLPVMAHPEPRTALLIGLGSGVTARAIAEHTGIQSVDVVEIEPAVTQALEYFEQVNHRIMESPNTRLIVNDGRNHLLETQEAYDIIASQPSNPWISGVSSLYTSDFYRIVKGKLSEGGIFCQWIHCYSISFESLAMVMNTIQMSFKEVQLWMSNVGDLLVLASDDSIDIIPERIHEVVNANASVKKEFSRFLRLEKPMDVMGRLLLDRPGITALSEGSRANSDDHPYLEFLAPRDLYRNEIPMIINKIISSSERMPPEAVVRLQDKGLLSQVYYHRSILLDPSPSVAEQFARAAIDRDRSEARNYSRLAEVLLNQGRLDEARETVMQGLAIAKSAYGIRVLSDILTEDDKREEALLLLDENRNIVADFEEKYGTILFQMEAFSQALPFLYKALATGQGEEYLVLEKVGWCLDHLGAFDAAEDYYRKSLEINEMNVRVQLLLGEMYWRHRKFEEAAERFEFLVEYWSVKPLIYERLADCYVELNRPDKAAFIRERILPKYVN